MYMALMVEKCLNFALKGWTMTNEKPKRVIVMEPIGKYEDPVTKTETIKSR